MNNCSVCQPAVNDKAECQKYEGGEKRMINRTQTRETEEAVEILTDVAGFNKENIAITVEGNQLTVVCSNEAENAGKLIHQEFDEAGVRREFALSDKIDQAAISAEVNNGVLRLVLKKTAKAQPRRIEIV